ncbi:hypothetical protein CRYUN_Cryun01aG0162600 [Craigia yunnanensis]
MGSVEEKPAKQTDSLSISEESLPFSSFVHSYKYFTERQPRILFLSSFADSEENEERRKWRTRQSYGKRNMPSRPDHLAKLGGASSARRPSGSAKWLQPPSSMASCPLRHSHSHPCLLKLKVSMWNHANCILRKANQIKSYEDQQRIRNYVEAGGPSNTKAVTPTAMEYAIEVSQTSRASCKRCTQKIMKGEVLISSKPEGQGSKGLVWIHAKCFMELSPATHVEKLPRWENLSSSDQAPVCALVKKVPAAKNGKGTEVPEDKQPQSASRAGTKCKKDVGDDQKSKVTKLEGDTKELWSLKDELKKHVTTAELSEMLEANGQDATGSELDLHDCCADGMMFGALVVFAFLEACIVAMATFQHGASVLTLLLNLNVLKGNGKS